MSWDKSSSSKTLLQKAYADPDPVTDIGLYVENLSKKILAEKNYAAFDFLKPNIANLQSPDSLSSTIALQQIESIIEELKVKYPDQAEVAEKVENILNIANLQAHDNLSSTIALQQIESIIEELKEVSPDQVEIIEKLENLVDSYKKMLKIIKQ